MDTERVDDDIAWVGEQLAEICPGASVVEVGAHPAGWSRLPANARLWRAGGVVAKLHSADASHEHLSARLAVAADPRAAGILLAPLEPAARKAPSGRLLTLWPRVEPVDPTADPLPWDALGDTVARLHSLPVEGHLPAADPRARARRAVAQVPDPTQRALLEQVLAGVPDDVPASIVVHGDLHLGQLGQVGQRGQPGHLGTHATNGSQPGQWLLLDIDDLGRGHPVADLARPAALWAVGLLADEDWTRLLAAYRRRSPGLLPPDEHLWEHLDPPARMALVILTAQALRHEEDAEIIRRLLSACTRITQTHAPDLGP